MQGGGLNWLKPIWPAFGQFVLNLKYKIFRSAASIAPPKLPAKKLMKQGEQRILIIGESGVGKTTFINGLDMYQQCPTFESAVNNSQPLINSSFIHRDDVIVFLFIFID